MSYEAPAAVLNGQDHIVVAYTVEEIKNALSTLKKGAVVFIDVDDTLITPQSASFRISSPYRFLIDDLKKNQDKIPNSERIISRWRLQRKTILVSDHWPDFINTLKRTYSVYALTKMQTRVFGEIPSMEKWRYNELKKKGISFTSTYNGTTEATLVTEPGKPYPATFYQGIFITGSYQKSDVIRAYLKAEKPTQIVLIDDRSEHLQDVIEECNRQSIPFLGILYKGMELIPGQADPSVAEFQKQHLLEKEQWLEDEAAAKALSLSSKKLASPA